MQSGEFDQALYNRVTALVIKQTNVKAVNPETRLFQDLGVDGDDGDELMQQFGDQFNVNMDNFYLNYHKHFGPELPWLAFLWPYWILFKRDKLNKSCTAWKMIPISVIDLYNAAKAKEFPNLSTREPE